jgi:hypothetical protein
MFTEHNELGIELGGGFKGHAEGPLGIGAMLMIALLFAFIFCRQGPLG